MKIHQNREKQTELEFIKVSILTLSEVVRFQK